MLIKLAKVCIKIENSVPQKIKRKIEDELGNYIITNNKSAKPDIIIYTKENVNMQSPNNYRNYEIDERFVKVLSCGPILFTANFQNKSEPVEINIIKERDIKSMWYFIENIIKIAAFYRYDLIFVHGAGFLSDNVPIFIIGTQQCGKTKILLEAAKNGLKLINEDFIIIDKNRIYPYFPPKLYLAKHHFDQLNRKDFLIKYFQTKIHGDFSRVGAIFHNIFNKYAYVDFAKIFPNINLCRYPIEIEKANFVFLNPIYSNNKIYRSKIKKEEIISKSFGASYIDMSTFINLLTYMSLANGNISSLKFINDYYTRFFQIFSSLNTFTKLTYNSRFAPSELKNSLIEITKFKC